jgi:hypothetical protein
MYPFCIDQLRVPKDAAAIQIGRIARPLHWIGDHVWALT